FPLLIKLLDAEEKLSLQVHPPAHVAARLGGEPKTEMWYIADARAGAELYAGLRRGVTRAEFERRINDGTVADCFHRLPVKPGDVMVLPSGRVHAIDPLFSATAIKVLRGEFFELCGGGVEIIGVLEGTLNAVHRDGEAQLAPGQFCLKPAGVEPLTLRFQPPVHFLQIKPG